jgi:hypothetical protein
LRHSGAAVSRSPNVPKGDIPRDRGAAWPEIDRRDAGTMGTVGKNPIEWFATPLRQADIADAMRGVKELVAARLVTLG